MRGLLLEEPVRFWLENESKSAMRRTRADLGATSESKDAAHRGTMGTNISKPWGPNEIDMKGTSAFSERIMTDLTSQSGAGVRSQIPPETNKMQRQRTPRSIWYYVVRGYMHLRVLIFTMPAAEQPNFTPRIPRNANVNFATMLTIESQAHDVSHGNLAKSTR